MRGSGALSWCRTRSKRRACSTTVCGVDITMSILRSVPALLALMAAAAGYAHAAPTVAELHSAAQTVCTSLYPGAQPGCSDFLVNLAIAQSFLDDEMIDHYNSEFGRYGVYLLSEEQAQQAIDAAAASGSQRLQAMLRGHASLEDLLNDLPASQAVILALVAKGGPQDWQRQLASFEGQARLWSELFAEDDMAPEIFMRDVKAFKEEHQTGGSLETGE